MAENQIQYRVLRRNVKYPRLEFKTGTLVVIVPKGVNVSSLIEKHKNWILKKKEFIEEAIKEVEQEKLVNRSEEEFKNLIKTASKEAEKILKVKPRKIYFRLMKTKWGSCSKKKNITFNVLLKYLPEDLICYVVFHEFCHLIIPRHNKKFWFLVSQKFANYEQLERKLFGYWFLIWKNGLNGKYQNIAQNEMSKNLAN